MGVTLIRSLLKLLLKIELDFTVQFYDPALAKYLPLNINIKVADQKPYSFLSNLVPKIAQNNGIKLRESSKAYNIDKQTALFDSERVISGKTTDIKNKIDIFVNKNI